MMLIMISHSKLSFSKSGIPTTICQGTKLGQKVTMTRAFGAFPSCQLPNTTFQIHLLISHNGLVSLKLFLILRLLDGIQSTAKVVCAGKFLRGITDMTIR